MEKSKFKQLIQGMVFEMLEGKGDAPGATRKTSLATPGSVSKGGFTLQDFNSVLSGVAGERSGKSGSRSSKRASKWSAFKGGRNIDTWRLAVLQGGAGVGKTHKLAGKNVAPQHGYMQTKSKTKDASANITSLAAIRKTDYDFQKKGGGRKTRTESSQMKVSSAYINQKADALATYEKMMDSQKSTLKDQVAKIDSEGGAGTIEYHALMELILDIDLRMAEYTARWKFATAAYNNDQSGMNAAREEIEGHINTRKTRVKNVGSKHHATEAPPKQWAPGTKYSFGDKVLGKNGVTYTATAGGRSWRESDLGNIDPMKGHPMWSK